MTELSLEERIVKIEIGGKTLNAEVRQYYPGDRLLAWVPELNRTITMQDSRDASTSGKFINVEEGATMFFNFKNYKKGDTFVRYKIPKRTSTN